MNDVEDRRIPKVSRRKRRICLRLRQTDQILRRLVRRQLATDEGKISHRFIRFIKPAGRKTNAERAAVTPDRVQTLPPILP